MITTNLYVIAAICGNFWQESTINPGIWEGLTVGAPGYGLGQWTDNAQVSRRTELFNYLDLRGLPHDSGPGQLDFLIYEDVWLPVGAGGYVSAYASLSDFLASTSTTLSDLVLEWMYCWEGINDGTQNVRLERAADILDVLRNDPGTRDPWYASNAYLTLAQARNNALLIMDYFAGASPTPVPEPTFEEFMAILKRALDLKKKGGIFILW